MQNAKLLHSGSGIQLRNPQCWQSCSVEHDPVSSAISDLLLFFSYFASQNKEITSGNALFKVCCVN